MTDMKSAYIRTWLRDAHAMEEQAEKLFSDQAERMKDYPELQQKLHNEVTYSKEHQLALSIRIQQLGSAKSFIKDVGAKLIAELQTITGMAMDDEPVKGILALYTFSQMAIGSYKVLIAASLKMNDDETLKICKSILSQSEARAAWIEDELASVTGAFLSKLD